MRGKRRREISHTNICPRSFPALTRSNLRQLTPSLRAICHLRAHAPAMEFVNALETSTLQALPPTWLAWYRDMLSKGNPLSKNMPLMNPFHVLLIVIAYLTAVFVGKFLMSFKKTPFELRAYTVAHNLFLVVLSSYMFFQNLYQAYLLGFSVWGNGVGTTAAALPVRTSGVPSRRARLTACLSAGSGHLGFLRLQDL